MQKVAEPFESAAWRVSDDSSAGGSTRVSKDVPAEISGVSKTALDIDAEFSGTGFEFFKAAPLAPLVVPGVLKNVSVWVRADGKYGWVMQFKDGWGRSEVGGQKLEWNITKGASGAWKKMSFDVPGNWVQPVTIDGVLGHNWDSKTVKAGTHLFLDQLEVQTDLSGVDAETGVLRSWQAPDAATDPQKKLYQSAPVTPLLQASFSGSQQHNVFSAVKPLFAFSAKNWRATPASGTLQWKVLDWQGNPIQNGNQVLNVEDNFALTLPLSATQFGVYKLDANISLNGGKSTPVAQPFAIVPVARELSDAEKDASPYGLNVLSARQPMVETFRKAGVVWFRDYAFDYSWMTRAKGADRSYGGWPWYPRIVKQYEQSGARVLACLKTAIVPPSAGGTNAPNLQWTRELVGIETAFPSLRAFELDNEYDLNRNRAAEEEAIGWKNYANYHKKFGEVTQVLSDGQYLAVENGRAGIWPERLRRVVQSGAFANIDVVNSHHYAGTDAPELNVVNHNMGFSGDENVLTFFDQLRAAKKSGAADGKARQHWLTEFGWDTKAGPVVSPEQQAAYLARGFMMLQAAGTEKGFWYWDLDSPVANQFFDGCGLFTYDQYPKLSYAAYAGLTQILPRPQYIGTISAGENTWGYLFRNDGKLVAALWTLDGKKGPSVNFEGAKVYDFAANPQNASTAELGLMPVYAVGVAPDSKWVKQAAYSLETPYLVTATAGDTITTNLEVKNTRAATITGKARLQLPAGWTDASGEQSINVVAGKTASTQLSFRITPDEPLGEKVVRVAINEGEPLTTIPLRVQIGRPILLSVQSLKGEPGTSPVSIRVSNRSAKPLDGMIRFKLPAGWSTPTGEIKVQALKPMEVREITANVQWTPNWKEGESATVEYSSSDGRTASQPLIPSQLTLAKAPDTLKMDGDLKDWPARNILPAWVLGSTSGAPNASVYMGWSGKGLYVALDVKDSKGAVPDPKTFWAGDVLELFLDTRNKKSPRKYESGDHQFWLAPQFEQKRVYVGQWKRGTEIPEINYDIAGIQSAAMKTADGYVLEAFLPASLIQGFKAAPGTRLGLNLNLTVRSTKGDREVFWTVPKSEGTEQPANWGTVVLGN